MTEQIEISNAEWEVMRVIWTLGQATSRQLIEIMEVKQNWKPATTKTLLGRLVAKDVLETKKEGRGFIYLPLVQEQATIDAQLMQNFSNICQMHVGKTLAYLVENLNLTQGDIAKITAKLEDKKSSAPEKLECDCIPAEFHRVGCQQCK